MDASERITSKESNLTVIFEKFFIQYYKDYLAQQKQAAALNKTLQKENFEFAYLYILVMFGIFTVLIISMLASTVRSRRQEHHNDPYHTYIANDSRKSKMEKDFPKIYINENVARALQNMSEAHNPNGSSAGNSSSPESLVSRCSPSSSSPRDEVFGASVGTSVALGF